MQLANGLEEEDARGHRSIERFDPISQRNANAPPGLRPRLLRGTMSFVADDQGKRPKEIFRVVWLSAGSLSYKNALGLAVACCSLSNRIPGKIGPDWQGNMRSGCGTYHLWTIAIDAALSEQNFSHIGSQGCAQDSAQIAGISQVIKNQHSRTISRWATSQQAFGLKELCRDNAEHAL